MTPDIRVVTEEGVRWIELDRADRHNALTGEMVDALTEAFRESTRVPGLRLVVVRGGGVDFCAGLDLDQFYAAAEAGAGEHRREAERLSGLLQAIAAAEVPTLAFVQGKALGIGATLALACDVTIMSSSAVLSFPEMTFGFLPAFAAPILLKLAGPKTAFDLLASGRVVRAEEARQVGLASRVVPAEGFDAVAGSVVRGFCSCTAEQLRALKQHLRLMADRPLAEALGLAVEVHARARASESFREAARQFREMT
jgi:methylglutaconyl-CoA hydratase